MNAAVNTCPVSVILPCYEAEDSVSAALKSAAFQTLPPAEILIFNDGSHDSSKENITKTIEEITNHTPSKIRFFDFQKNRGVYAARNDALFESTQPYLAFLDADDYWHPQKLELQYNYFKNDSDLALCCHGVKFREGTAETLQRFEDNHTPQTRILKEPEVLLRNIMVTISVMIKKPENLVFDESKPRGSDMLFWLEIVLRGGKALWIEEDMSFTSKPLFGAGGLSGSIWKAEMAQQDNLKKLWARGYISLPYSLFLRTFSFAKMIRRYILYFLRSLKNRLKR